MLGMDTHLERQSLPLWVWTLPFFKFQNLIPFSPCVSLSFYTIYQPFNLPFSPSPAVRWKFSAGFSHLSLSYPASSTCVYVRIVKEVDMSSSLFTPLTGSLTWSTPIRVIVLLFFSPYTCNQKEEAKESEDRSHKKRKSLSLCCHLLFAWLISHTIGPSGPLPFSHQPFRVYNLSVSLAS